MRNFAEKMLTAVRVSENEILSRFFGRKNDKNFLQENSYPNIKTTEHIHVVTKFEIYSSRDLHTLQSKHLTSQCNDLEC